MLKKKNRIRASSFNDALKNTRQGHGRFVSISFSQSPSMVIDSRFAVVVSKAVAKQAVTRNKLRRWVYSLIHECGLDAQKNILCLVFFKKGSKDILYKDLKEDLIQLFKKTHLLS